MTISFDMAIEDDQVLERIAAVQGQMIDEDTGPSDTPRPSLIRRLRRRSSPNDLRMTFNMAAVAMLSEGAAKVPGLSISQVTVHSELPVGSE